RELSYLQRRLTVPLLCSPGCRRLEVEGLHQVERGLAQVQVVQGGPQVDDVALLLAARIEAVEDVLVEVDAEGAAAAVAAVGRARAAPLGTGALEAQAELIDYPGDWQLAFEMGKVDRAAGAGQPLCGTGNGTGRGDLWLCRRVRREARGCFFC